MQPSQIGSISTKQAIAGLHNESRSARLVGTPSASVTFKRRSSEIPLFATIVVISVLLWVGMIASVVFAFYAAVLGLICYISHLVFVTYIRGSAVKVSEQQFPELYARLIYLSQRMELQSVPDFYLTQSGGSLNALATRFHRSDMIVMFSELLEACEDNEQARDFIIAHELAHLKARHLRWWLLTTPGRMIPFLGHAYNRACEYTADSWGFAVSGKTARHAQGLVVLSIGGKLARSVNVAEFLEQRKNLAGGVMTLGRWLSTYPALSERLAALTPSGPATYATWGGTIKALCFIAVLGVVPLTASIAGIALLGANAGSLGSQQTSPIEQDDNVYSEEYE